MNRSLISELLAQLPEQRRAFGYIDNIEEGVITGWAVDLSQGNAPASLFIFIDDEPVANIHCSLRRMDLAAAGLPAVKAGFQYEIPAKFFDGKYHRLAVRLSSGAFLEPSPELDIRDGAIWFQLEPPSLIEGVVDGLVQGAICGWALRTDPVSNARIGGLDIVVSYEGQEIGRVKADRFRPDVARAANGPAQCGFIFLPPARFRDGGEYELRFHVAPEGKELKNSPLTVEYPSRAITTKLARLQGAVETLSTQLWELKKELRSLLSTTPYDLSSHYDAWAREYFRTLEKNRVKTFGTNAGDGPLVSVICPTYRPDLRYFREAIESVIKQTYRNWELLVIDDHSNRQELSACIAEFCQRDRRIRAISLKKNLGISGATNEGIKAARGEWIAFFDHDDLLEPCALELMIAAAGQTGAKMLYSDEDKIEDGGNFSEPNLKPDWNYRLLLAQNYVCHLLMVEAKTLEKAGLLRSKYDGAQDHDLVLRLSEILAESEICHVREILYHWR
ncbi:MAG: glycosyltransferase, partial [Acetobacteraceae bacterium]|nr:glycosyltransferase [Acetobacteraceae bacterium]